MSNQRADAEKMDLTAVFAHVRGVESRVDKVESAVTDLGKLIARRESAMNEKLDAISRLVTIQSAQPQYKVGEVLDVVVKAGGLLAMCATAIIYIATSISSAPLASVNERLRFDSDRLGRIERLIERTTKEARAQ